MAIGRTIRAAAITGAVAGIALAHPAPAVAQPGTGSSAGSGAGGAVAEPTEQWEPLAIPGNNPTPIQSAASSESLRPPATAAAPTPGVLLGSECAGPADIEAGPPRTRVPPPETPVSVSLPQVRPNPQVRPISSDDDLPAPKMLSVLGGLAALAVAGIGSGVIGFRSAAAAQARVDAARAEFFGRTS